MAALVRHPNELLRFDFKRESRSAPARAGDLAFRRFCTPRLSERRSSDHDLLTERARFHLRAAQWVRVATAAGEVQAYVLDPETARGPASSVLVVHGWTGEASFMAVIAEQIRRAGFRAVLFDCPAHGLSAGRRASLMDCSRAVLTVAETLGPIRFAVAHSMGCLAALLAGEGKPPLARAYPFERYVLISSPNRFSEVTQEFGRGLKLTRPAQRAYERQLERIAHRTIGEFTGAKLLAATGRPALLLHDREDREVSFRNAEEIAAACPLAELQASEGFGHRKILYAPPVIRAAVAYLTRP